MYIYHVQYVFIRDSFIVCNYLKIYKQTIRSKYYLSLLFKNVIKLLFFKYLVTLKIITNLKLKKVKPFLKIRLVHETKIEH